MHWCSKCDKDSNNDDDDDDQLIGISMGSTKEKKTVSLDAFLCVQKTNIFLEIKIYT